MDNIRIEGMAEILETLGIQATNEQVKTIVEDFCLHLEMEREMSSYGNLGYSEPCRECKSLKSKLAELESDNKVFIDSVKDRRNADRVWIQNGEVRYEK